MAEKRDFTPHQQKIVRNYYKNQGAIREQSLADLVGDLYLATTEAKTASLWKRAEKLLEGLGVPASARLVIVENATRRRWPRSRRRDSSRTARPTGPATPARNGGRTERDVPEWAAYAGVVRGGTPGRSGASAGAASSSSAWGSETQRRG